MIKVKDFLEDAPSHHNKGIYIYSQKGSTLAAEANSSVSHSVKISISLTRSIDLVEI